MFKTRLHWCFRYCCDILLFKYASKCTDQCCPLTMYTYRMKQEKFHGIPALGQFRFHIPPTLLADGILPHRVLSLYSLTAGLLGCWALRLFRNILLAAVSDWPVVVCGTARLANLANEGLLNRDRILWMNSFMRISIGAQRLPAAACGRCSLAGWWYGCLATMTSPSDAAISWYLATLIRSRTSTMTLTTFMVTVEKSLRCETAKKTQNRTYNINE